MRGIPPDVRAVALAALLALPGCAAAQSDEATEKVQTRLVFAPEKPGDRGPDSTRPLGDVFLWGGLEQFKDAEQDRRLARECLEPSKSPTGFTAILSFFIGPLIGLATDAIKSELDEELKKYGAEFKVADSANFYRTAGQDGAAGRAQAWRCFRVTRIRTKSGADPKAPVTRTVEFDLLAQVAVVGPNGQVYTEGKAFEDAPGIKVRPLRAYLGRPLALKGSQIGLSTSVSFDAVWRDGNEGKKQTLFTTPLFEHKFRRTNGVWSTAPYYVPDTDPDGQKNPAEFPSWSRQPLLPYVPISSPGGAGATHVTVTVAGAEVGDGDGKATLKAIRKLFGASQDDINSLLTKAAKSVIDPEKPSPPPSPEFFCGTFTSTSDGSGTVAWEKKNEPCPAPAAP